MPNAQSLLADPDVREAMERALNSQRGVSVTLSDEKAAVRWLSRANSFRVIDRRVNAKLYPESHTLHNSSAYDVLLMSREGKTIKLLPRRAEDVTVVEL